MRHAPALLALLLPLAASAQEPAAIAPVWGLDQLMQQRAQIEVARASFTEVRKIPAADTTLTASGTLTFRAPDRLERETAIPSVERTTIEGERITLETEAAGGKLTRRQFALTDLPALRPFFSALRAMLAGNLELLQREFETTLDGTEQEWQLKLVPRAATDRQVVRDIAITGRGIEILAIELRQKNGDSSRTTLTPEDVEFKPVQAPNGGS